MREARQAIEHCLYTVKRIYLYDLYAIPHESLEQE